MAGTAKKGDPLAALTSWTGPVGVGPFRFREPPPPPVRIVRRIVAPGPDGPVYTGHVMTRRPDEAEHHYRDRSLAGRRCPLPTTRTGMGTP